MDTLPRNMAGAVTSIAVGVIAVGISGVAGVILGLVSCYIGGCLDDTIMVQVDVVFFFQAEDGIRDRDVTGVQTCALPISRLARSARVRAVVDRVRSARRLRPSHVRRIVSRLPPDVLAAPQPEYEQRDRGRSEERRVGKEWRGRRWARQEKRRKVN